MANRRALLPAALLAVVAAAVACGSDDEQTEIPDAAVPDSAPSDVPDAKPADASGDAADAAPGRDAAADADAAVCESPLAVPLDPTAKAKATTALQALAPSATFEWSDTLGTIKSIAGLTVTPACTGTEDVYEKLLDYLSASPDLFQIDRTEWSGNGPLPCSAITGFQLVTIRRQKYGPFDLHNDVFSVVADVQGGAVLFRNFSGTYVPRAPASILQKFQECPDVPEIQLAPKLRAKTFGYTTFDSCIPDTTLEYTAAANDTLTFGTGTELLWEETPNLTIHRQRVATLTVATANYTNDLRRSNANCPDDEGNPRIGWIRTFDAVTGEILSDWATPDPYCHVCFK